MSPPIDFYCVVIRGAKDGKPNGPGGHQKLHWIYPLVNIHIAIENGPVEIVDLPIIKHGGSFHRFLYVYQVG